MRAKICTHHQLDRIWPNLDQRLSQISVETKSIDFDRISVRVDAAKYDEFLVLAEYDQLFGSRADSAKF